MVLVFAGHDPTGGAGIQADIETISALGGRALTIPTALTLQSSKQVTDFETTDSSTLLQQAEILLQEFAIAAIKIGMVGSHILCEAIHTLLQQHPEIPVVLDPVLAGGGGGRLANNRLAESIRTLLLPHTLLATPNRNELQQLIPEADSAQSRTASALQLGCSLLVTGTDTPLAGEAADRVYHQLLLSDNTTHAFDYPRLPHSYHGSGCTLASAIATRIAFGDTLHDAVQQGLDYTWNSLQQGEHPTDGQYFPNRFFQQT